MTEAVIAQKFPYLLELEPGQYWWCACGRSAKQPFCDGSHGGTDFTPVAFSLTEKTEVALCGCKRALTPPYCDGQHKKI